MKWWRLRWCPTRCHFCCIVTTTVDASPGVSEVSIAEVIRNRSPAELGCGSRLSRSADRIILIAALSFPVPPGFNDSIFTYMFLPTNLDIWRNGTRGVPISIKYSWAVRAAEFPLAVPWFLHLKTVYPSEAIPHPSKTIVEMFDVLEDLISTIGLSDTKSWLWCPCFVASWMVLVVVVVVSLRSYAALRMRSSSLKREPHDWLDSKRWQSLIEILGAPAWAVQKIERTERSSWQLVGYFFLLPISSQSIERPWSQREVRSSQQVCQSKRYRRERTLFRLGQIWWRNLTDTFWVICRCWISSCAWSLQRETFQQDFADHAAAVIRFPCSSTCSCSLLGDVASFGVCTRAAAKILWAVVVATKKSMPKMERPPESTTSVSKVQTQARLLKEMLGWKKNTNEKMKCCRCCVMGSMEIVRRRMESDEEIFVLCLCRTSKLKTKKR